MDNKHTLVSQGGSASITTRYLGPLQRLQSARLIWMHQTRTLFILGQTQTPKWSFIKVTQNKHREILNASLTIVCKNLPFWSACQMSI